MVNTDYLIKIEEGRCCEFENVVIELCIVRVRVYRIPIFVYFYNNFYFVVVLTMKNNGIFF